MLLWWGVYEPEEKRYLTLFLSTTVDFALADAELTRAQRTLYWHIINHAVRESVCVYGCIKSAWLDITQEGGINLLN